MCTDTSSEGLVKAEYCDDVQPLKHCKENNGNPPSLTSLRADAVVQPDLNEDPLVFIRKQQLYISWYIHRWRDDAQY